jgi:polysaccharide deacetylase family protein (PEP-CTERM system associated)
MSIANAMTVDVEDFFQVEAFARIVPRDRWDQFDRRVEANTDRILAQMDAAGAHGTFFTLGWVAERHPELVRRIVAGGHELASHGYGHQRVDSIAPDAFAEDIHRAKAILDIGGVAVIGYRAPTFSIGPRTPWAADALLTAGYRYSSSVYPVRHDLYGDPDAPRGPFHPHGTELWELPMTTTRLGGRNRPCSGGGWFRLMPYAVFRQGLRRVNRSEGLPGIFYTHPWEFDPGQPRIPGAGRLSRFRHYVNLDRTEGKFDALLRDFTWDRMDRVFPFVQAA